MKNNKTKTGLNKLQYFFIIAGTLLLLWFMAPLCKGVFNIGNALGMLFSAGIILLSVFWNKVSLFLCTAWKAVPGKILISLVAVLLTAAVCYGAVLSTLMVSHSVKAPPQNTTLVVLGCRVYGTRPSLMLIDRLDASIEYLNENPGAKCILSGGQGSGEDISEAEAMYKYLTEKGIDKSRLFLEDKSTDTYENIRFSKKIADDNSMGSSVAICSQEFHQYRASIIAEKADLTPYSVSAHSKLFLLPTYWVREMLGLTQEIFLK